MTERRLRELFVWLEIHREFLAQQVVCLSEAASWARERVNLPMAADRVERVAFETRAAMKQLERVYPRDLAAEEDTLVLGPQPVRRRRFGA